LSRSGNSANITTRGLSYDGFYRFEPTGVQDCGLAFSLDFRGWHVGVPGRLVGDRDHGTYRPLASRLASSSFFRRIGTSFQQHHRFHLLTMKARLFNYLATFIIIGLAGWAGWSLYQKYIQNPWTRDSQVRANIVGIAPRVSGPIIQVTVRDNQEVKTGDLLFEIDPADFEALLNVASGQVLNAEANLKQQQQNLDRQYDLYSKHVVPAQDYQNAQDSFAAAQAS